MTPLVNQWEAWLTKVSWDNPTPPLVVQGGWLTHLARVDQLDAGQPGSPWLAHPPGLDPWPAQAVGQPSAHWLNRCGLVLANQYGRSTHIRLANPVGGLNQISLVNQHEN